MPPFLSSRMFLAILTVAGLLLLPFSNPVHAAQTLPPIVVDPADKRADWQNNLQRIFDQAHTEHREVKLSEGTYRHSSVLIMNGIHVSGDGASTVLEGTERDKSAVILTGNGASLSSLSLGFKATERSSADESSLVLVRDAVNFTVSNLILNGSDSVGIFILGSIHGTVEGNDISNTLADSIHITGSSSYVTVRKNTTHNSGDDGIAAVSYEKNDRRVSRVVIENNHVLNNKFARGISAIGSEEIEIRHNTVTCNNGYAGIYVASERSFLTYGTRDISVKGNTVKGCGGRKIGHSAILVFDGYKGNDHIAIEGNRVDDSPGMGIDVRGPKNTHITIGDNVINASVGMAFSPAQTSDDVRVFGNKIH